LAYLKNLGVFVDDVKRLGRNVSIVGFGWFFIDPFSFQRNLSIKRESNDVVAGLEV